MHIHEAECQLSIDSTVVTERAKHVVPISHQSTASLLDEHLVLNAINPNGYSSVLYEYIVSVSHVLWRIRQFCIATKQMDLVRVFQFSLMLTCRCTDV